MIKVIKLVDISYQKNIFFNKSSTNLLKMTSKHSKKRSPYVHGFLPPPLPFTSPRWAGVHVVHSVPISAMSCAPFHTHKVLILTAVLMAPAADSPLWTYTELVVSSSSQLVH